MGRRSISAALAGAVLCAFVAQAKNVQVTPAIGSKCGTNPLSDGKVVQCTQREFEVDRIYGSIAQVTVRIYGSDAQAEKCFKAALQEMTLHWNTIFTGPCLRASFHDCGTYHERMCTEVNGLAEPRGSCGGCNGSFRREFDEGAKANWKIFGQQNGMQLCYNFLWGDNHRMVERIRAHDGCSAMTEADIINLVGMVAIFRSGGLPAKGCNWTPGRPDTGGVDETWHLPAHTSTGAELMQTFEGYEFNQVMDFFDMGMAETVATLNGAHTVGYDRVTDESPASQGLGELSGTDILFDGQYYKEIVTGRKGWFESDRHGLCNELADPHLPLKKRRCLDEASPLAATVKKFAAGFQSGDDSAFHCAFCKAYQMISHIGMVFDPNFHVDNPQFRITKELMASLVPNVEAAKPAAEGAIAANEALTAAALSADFNVDPQGAGAVKLPYPAIPQ
ncbi:heme peroxidase [Tribonema minus]|uniref:Heme peroxidase n=1 Tax=Tribonema minus TaxID=303371 RepID=A0A835YQB1_9STRA|nr:heme peroxidase [Tribonema minus]